MKILKFNPDKDMKELEKYGFVYNDKCGQYIFQARNCNGYTAIKINVWNRKVIFTQGQDYDYKCVITLYDLIKANLLIVEEVEE